MNNLSTELKTHRVFIKDEEPVLISFADFERISNAINEKAEYVRIGNDKLIKRYFIEKIQPITKEERGSKNYKVVNYKTPEQEKEEFKKKFSLDCINYMGMSKDERAEFAEKNPCQAFQFDFYEKNSNSTLKEQNEALIKFIKERKNGITPSFLKK